SGRTPGLTRGFARIDLTKTGPPTSEERQLRRILSLYPRAASDRHDLRILLVGDRQKVDPPACWHLPFKVTSDDLHLFLVTTELEVHRQLHQLKTHRQKMLAVVRSCVALRLGLHRQIEERNDPHQPVPGQLAHTSASER